MDFIFLLEEGDRIVILHQLIQSFGCTYICLWSYLPQPCNYFIHLDGLFHGENNVARRLFEEYRHSLPISNDGRVPGYAFRNNIPYMELQFEDLQTLASTPVQLQFYREAGIKTAILMGCGAGEIELGMSTNPPGNMEMEMRMLFFNNNESIIPPPSSNKPSNSSSSWRSLSLESQQEHTSLLFDVPSSNPLPEQSSRKKELFSEQHVAPDSTGAATIPFPFSSMQSEVDDAIARAYLAVIASSSSPSPSSSALSSAQSFRRTSAFRRYNNSNSSSNMQPRTNVVGRRGINMFKRSVGFLRHLHLLRRQQGFILHHSGGGGGGGGTSTAHVHHVISERKRREKLNESFQQLRSLLPPGSKKDKASVLSNTTEYLASLKAQVEDLTKKNQSLEAQLSRPPHSEAVAREEESGAPSTSGGEETLDVRIANVEESTSEGNRCVDLRVSVRGEIIISDLVIRLLEFLKRVESAELISIEANTTTMVQSTTINHVTLRLRIEGNEWDESDFLEAVKRVVADLAQ